ncbi:MAG: hypothetical protein O7A98_09470 [Acidobacteria bacterium]|nr:hypothetical protein [Acidobacteriota bacterium]
MSRVTLGCLVLVWLVITPTPSFGQVVLAGTESLSFDRPEAWAMKYFASLSLMTGMGPALSSEAGSIDLGIELGSVPSLSLRERTVGFNGTKSEDINRTPLFGRLRAAFGLPGQFILEASYLPPIDISGVEPDLFALALARPLTRSSAWRTGVRLTMLYGSYSGDFTCSADEIANGPNEFQCEQPSRDEITLRSAGLEFQVARSARAGSRLEPYFGVAVHLMDLDFQVKAEYLGLIDQSRLVTDGTTFSASLGLAYRTRGGLRWAGELFYSPLDVVRPPSTTTENDALFNVRVLLTYRLR